MGKAGLREEDHGTHGMVGDMANSVEYEEEQ